MIVTFNYWIAIVTIKDNPNNTTNDRYYQQKNYIINDSYSICYHQ